MSRHLKRLSAPRVVRLHRKENKWTMKPSPGSHSEEKCIALGLIIRDYLKLCDTYREVKRVIACGDILVDGAKRKNHKYPCGFMDVISIPKLKKDYRIVYDIKGKLVLIPISSKDAEWKLRRIENKTAIKGNKIQLHFHDGTTLLVKKDEYKTGDVLQIAFKDNKILDVFKYEKGSISLIIGGSHIGEIAHIEDIKIVPSSKPNLAMLKGETDFSTLTSYLFPIGKTKSVITLPEVKLK
ncbi:MAG: 30S ribosomal protein S4e [Thermoplasmatota archaeon]